MEQAELYTRFETATETKRNRVAAVDGCRLVPNHHDSERKTFRRPRPNYKYNSLCSSATLHRVSFFFFLASKRPLDARARGLRYAKPFSAKSSARTGVGLSAEALA